MASGSKKVKEFYNRFPYPSKGLLGGYNVKRHAGKVLKAAGLKARDFRGKSVLEIGCGTGEIGISLAYNGANVAGVDFAEESLKRAGELAEKHGVSVRFIESDLFDLPKKLSERFDLVTLLGVAHHTRAPRKAFRVACSFVKENGIVLLGLYNKTARRETARKRKELEKKAGNGLEKKMELAEKGFGRSASEVEKICLADKYCHPLEKTVSLKRAKKWMEEEGFELMGCDPPQAGSDGESERAWLKLGRSFFVLAGKKKKKRFFVYLAECGDGSLYCGWTNDLEKRIEAHNSGKGAKYTRAKRPVRLVHAEEFAEKSAALKREREIKKMKKNEKKALFGC